MNLDKLSVNVKPLPAYQAMDLGMAVARAWYGQLWQLWWRASGVSLIIIMIVSLGLYYLTQKSDVVLVLSVMMVWWQKPKFERLLLVYLSQRLFDETYTTAQMMHNKANLTKMTVRQHINRLGGSYRTIAMPVYMLEGQTGKAAALRVKLLNRSQSNAVIWHGLVFYVMELVIWQVASNFLLWLMDIGAQFNIEHQRADWIDSVVDFVMYVLTVSVITPFFVASGFMVYLCRRSMLEGWDIELVFRKLLARYQKHQLRQQGEA